MHGVQEWPAIDVSARSLLDERDRAIFWAETLMARPSAARIDLRRSRARRAIAQSPARRANDCVPRKAIAGFVGCRPHLSPRARRGQSAETRARHSAAHS